MGEQTILVSSRGFLVDDTWVTLFVFFAFGNMCLLLGYMASGRRRSWWKRKRNAEQKEDDYGVARGAHRLPWEGFLILQFFSFNIQSIAQFPSVTEPGACTFDLATMEKTCVAESSITAFLYTLNMFLLAGYVWAYLTHVKTFLVALATRWVVLALSIAQFTLYIIVGAAGAASLQGVALGFDLLNLFLAWSGRKHSLNRLARIMYDVVSQSSAADVSSSRGNAGRTTTRSSKKSKNRRAAGRASSGRRSRAAFTTDEDEDMLMDV